MGEMRCAMAHDDRIRHGKLFQRLYLESERISDLFLTGMERHVHQRG